jgi:hypothetical protein
MVKCPLTTRFGKDVAGLVNWWIWKIGLSSVHEEIASTFKCTLYVNVTVLAKHEM